MSGDPGSFEAPTIRVVSGSPTPAELAAVTAILAALEVEESAAAAKRTTPVSVSAWQRSRRSLRTPIEPGSGQWAQHRA